MDTSQYEQLTYADVLHRYPRKQFKWATNIGTPRIRPFTQKDINNFPETYDYEGRKITPKLGRCLCIGYEGEFFDTSERSVKKKRIPVNPNEAPDQEGFRRYRIRNPKPIRYIIVNAPFILLCSPHDPWTSQPEGGVITWNGKVGKKCDMRIIKISIFEHTYEKVEPVNNIVQLARKINSLLARLPFFAK